MELERESKGSHFNRMTFAKELLLVKAEKDIYHVSLSLQAMRETAHKNTVELAR